MVGAINSSLAALKSAQTRIAASSSNIANQFSTSQRVDGQRVNETPGAADVTNIATGNGGVITQVVRDPTNVQLVFDPDNPAANEEGLVTLPDVDLENELVDQIQARTQFLAALRTIEREDENLGSLLDILE